MCFLPYRMARRDKLLVHRPDVKRRALLAFHKLSEYDPDILRDIVSKARKRLGDSDPLVVCAAFTLAEKLLKVRSLKP